MTYNLTVRLFCGEKCFGPGMAQLLRKVQELHSLRAAAMSMNMAYSKAWTITKKAQEALGFPLLHSVTGGRGGGGAGLTPEALKMEVQRAFRRMAAKEKKTRERRELNPAVSLQPQERGLRYDNLRSALAEEGVIRLLLLDDSLFGDTPPVPAESFSSPLLGRVYASLWESHMAGRPLSISSLSGELTGEEMSHLTGVVQKPESPAGGERALADYCRVIREEAQKRTAGAGTDPLAAAAEKYKNKKGYGGKHNDG